MFKKIIEQYREWRRLETAAARAAEDAVRWERIGHDIIRALVLQTDICLERRVHGLDFPYAGHAQKVAPGVYTIELRLPRYPKVVGRGKETTEN